MPFIPVYLIVLTYYLITTNLLIRNPKMRLIHSLTGTFILLLGAMVLLFGQLVYHLLVSATGTKIAGTTMDLMDSEAAALSSNLNQVGVMLITVGILSLAINHVLKALGVIR